MIGMSFFVKFLPRFQSPGFVVVLVLDKILILEDEHEDEYEKYQLRSPESALI